MKSWEPSGILGSALALMLLSSFINVVGDGIVFIKYPGDTMLGGAISAARMELEFCLLSRKRRNGLESSGQFSEEKFCT